MILRQFARGAAEVLLHPWRSAAPLLTVTLAAFLAGLFMLLLHNIEREIVRNRGQVQFTVYWNPGAEMNLVQGQWDGFVKLPGLKDVATFTPDQGLDALSRALGGKADLSWLRGKSPLPPTATLHFAPPPSNASGDEAAWSKAVLEKLRALPEVREVHYNPLQVDLARSWLGLAKRSLWPAVGALSFLAACIVGNAVRLAHYRRREEIEILRLIGATNWYVRAPLLASGVTLALAGSGLALASLKGIQTGLENALNAPPLWIRIEFIPLEQAGLLAGGLALFALVSSWLAAGD